MTLIRHMAPKGNAAKKVNPNSLHELTVASTQQLQ